MRKRRPCCVCSDEYWPRRETGCERVCYTIDDCWRQIVDVSYSYKEYLPLVQTVRKAMLPRE